MQYLADRPRAMRYEMSAPLLYRTLEQETWCEGRTENVSRTGVLFATAVPALPAETKIEFMLKLPALVTDEGGWVQCQGRVVRQASAPEAGACAMAATIDTYNFLPGPPRGMPFGFGS